MSEDPKNLLIQVGLRILRRRQELGLTQEALADRVGMVRGNIGPIEHGDRNLTLRTLCRLADALDTTVAELVGGAPAPTAPRDP